MNQISTSAETPAKNHAKPNGFVRFASTGARIVMGLLFFVVGLNGLLPFLPESADAMPAGAVDLTAAFTKSGYLVPLLGVTQAAAGALLLSKRFVPLALTLLAPVVINIVAFHAFLAQQGLPMAIIVLALEIYLAFVHRNAFRSVLASRA